MHVLSMPCRNDASVPSPLNELLSKTMQTRERDMQDASVLLSFAQVWHVWLVNELHHSSTQLGCREESEQWLTDPYVVLFLPVLFLCHGVQLLPDAP